jgi:hypothetical protein
VRRSGTSSSIWSSWASIWSSSSTWSGWASIWERQGRGTEDRGGQGVVDLEQAASIWSRQTRTEDGDVDLEQAASNRRWSRGTEVWRHEQGEGRRLGESHG